MNPILARIQEVLAKRGWSIGEAERAAKVTHSYLVNTIRRLSEADHKSIMPSTARKLAHGWNVSERWLLMGEGDMDGTVRETTHQRKQARIMAKARGIPDHVIAAADEEPDTTPPRELDAWLELMKQMWRIDQDLARATRPTPTPPPQSEVEPSIPPAPPTPIRPTPIRTTGTKRRR